MCVRAEAVPASADAVLKIKDFDVPQITTDVNNALEKTIWAALTGKDVFVGCMGGWGRTGLFLALIAKTLGVKDPVQFVRSNYTPHAVETKEQMAYVKEFDVKELRRWLIRASFKALLIRIGS
jgi:protein-tyrosine phosphatase